MLLWMKRLTCIERVRVIVFAGWAEAGQAIIRDFQNKATVHHAIRWLEISMAAKVAVVKIVHPLGERWSQALKGCCLALFFFCPTANHTWKHTKSRHMEMIRSDEWMYAEGFEKRLRFKDGTVPGEFLCQFLWWGWERVLNALMFNILWKRWVRHPSKLHQRLFSTERCYLRGEAGVLRHVCRSIQNPSKRLLSSQKAFSFEPD